METTYVWVIYFVHSVCLCFLIGGFRLLAFNFIIDMLWFKSAIIFGLFSVCSVCFLFIIPPTSRKLFEHFFRILIDASFLGVSIHIVVFLFCFLVVSLDITVYRPNLTDVDTFRFERSPEILTSFLYLCLSPFII